jgi:SAM-dependent methyltransferase
MQDYPTEVVRCGACGLIYRNPRPPADVLTRAYATDHYGQNRLEEIFDAQCELYRPKARTLRRWLPRGGFVRVVEIGSFVGGFLAAGEEYGWTMLGVDPGKEVNAFCSQRGLQVLTGTLPEMPLEPSSVDCVAIWNTFDQLPDPTPILTAARRALRPGGILAIRVPNGQCFWQLQRLLPMLSPPVAACLRVAMAWNNLITFPYLHGYSSQTLDWMLSRYGLMRISFHPDTLVRLSDEDTKFWAAWEERLLKGLWRAMMKIEFFRPGTAAKIAPWIDVYYRAVS